MNLAVNDIIWHYKIHEMKMKILKMLYNDRFDFYDFELNVYL